MSINYDIVAKIKYPLSCSRVKMRRLTWGITLSNVHARQNVIASFNFRVSQHFVEVIFFSNMGLGCPMNSDMVLF